MFFSFHSFACRYVYARTRANIVAELSGEEIEALRSQVRKRI
eukprot:COSAG06_NODE_49084_length_327_cov_5.662281_1_plen_41_part_10